MADTDGVFNAVVIKGDFVGDLMLEGRGAGAHPTASAVSADIVDIARGNRRPHSVFLQQELKPYKPPRKKPMRAASMWRCNCSTSRVLWLPLPAFWRTKRFRSKASSSAASPADAGTRATAPFMLITHDTLEPSIRKAMARIEKDGHVAGRRVSSALSDCDGGRLPQYCRARPRASAGRRG